MIAFINSPSQWLIVIVVLFLLFGAKRLPEIARGLGKSLGEFKKARQEFEDELMGSTHEAEKPQAPRAIASNEQPSPTPPASAPAPTPADEAKRDDQPQA